MSDLQCPATIVLLTSETVQTCDARELRLSRVVCDTTIPTHPGASTAAHNLATTHHCPIEHTDMPDSTTLRQCINHLADTHRGEQVAVVASAKAVCDALQQRNPPTCAITLAVDSDGWNILPG